jgi:hypothetical protein
LILKKTNPSPKGEGFGIEKGDLGFAIQPTDSKKSEETQTKECCRRRFGYWICGTEGINNPSSCGNIKTFLNSSHGILTVND